MQGTILSFRRGRHTQRTNQFLLEVPEVDTKAKTSKLIGKTVVWKSVVKSKDKKPKEITGKITKAHGSNGVVRVRFPKGLPGYAVRTKADIKE